jgi:hypothetical protein
MCNLYSVTKGEEAIRELAKAMRGLTGNMPPLPAVFPDKLAPVVRPTPDGARDLVMMRCASSDRGVGIYRPLARHKNHVFLTI